MISDKDNTVRLNGTDDSSAERDTIRIDKSQDTVRLDNSSDTVRIDNTQRAESTKVISSGLGGGLRINAGQKNTYTFNEKEYTLVKKISESTTEAQIFLIERDKNKYVLKYYYPFVKPKKDVIEKLRSFKHKDIVGVIDSGYHDERFYEITTYADQGSLQKHLPIKDVDLIKRMVKEISNALKHCHENGIIHRDIKPANIFIKDEKKKDVIVGDFGIASIVGSEEDLRRTSIFQTPIYAAPEYRMTLGGETIISKAVDFYALGITVWEMWTGKLPPDGMDDLEFLRLMFEGTPPLPSEMDKNVAHLVKGLTTRDYKKRWGYEEVQKWIKGESVEVHSESEFIESKVFHFGEINGEKIDVTKPKELAKLMHQHPDLGRKHLYRGTVKDWLKKINDQRLYLEVADITDYRFKDDEITGTKYAAYVIDSEYPFIGRNNKACKTKEELITELKQNFSDYTVELKDPNHLLFLYLLSKNLEKEVEQFRYYFNTMDAETSLYYLINSLQSSINANFSFEFVHNKEKQSVANIKQAAEAIYCSPNFAKSITSNKEFLVWLEFKDKDVCESFKSFVAEKGKSKSFTKVLPYVLDPERGYIGLKGEECKTFEDIGWEIAGNYREYIKILKNPDANLYYYYEAKGYTGEIEFYQKAFDMELAQNKPGVYNDYVAVCKIIKSTGCNMRITPGGVSLKTPDDVIKNYSKLDKVHQENFFNSSSFLNAWLAVFFHEEPMSTDDKFYIYFQEDYEIRLHKYFDVLKKLDSSNELVEKYEKAKKKIENIAGNLTNTSVFQTVEKYSALVLPIITALILFAYTLFVEENYLPGNAFSIDSTYYVVFAVLTSIYILWLGFAESDLSLSTGCIGGPIVGVIIAFFVYYLFYFIVSIPLLLAGVLGFAVYLWFNILSGMVESYNELQVELEQETDQEELDVALFKYVFGKTNEISLPSLQVNKDIINDRRIVRIKIWGASVGASLIFLAILFILLIYNPNISL